MHDKLPVENRNQQPDGTTYSFSPTLFYEKQAVGVVPIDKSLSKYVWVPQIIGIPPLEIYTGAGTSDILEIIRRKLEKDGMNETFICFLLICGMGDITVIFSMGNNCKTFVFKDTQRF